MPFCCIWTKSHHHLLGLQSRTCSPAQLLESFSWPLHPHSPCSSHTGLPRMPKHARSHRRAFPLAILCLGIFCCQLLLSWHSPRPKSSREDFLDHLSWKDSICHFVSSCFIFTLAFITTWYFLFYLLVCFSSCLSRLLPNPQCLEKSPGQNGGSVCICSVDGWTNKRHGTVALCLSKGYTVPSKQPNGGPGVRRCATNLPETVASNNSNHLLCSQI